MVVLERYTVKRILTRIQFEISKILSYIFTGRLHIHDLARPENVLLANEVFSISENRFKFIGKKPYWLDFHKIKLRTNGYTIISDAEVIDRGIVLTQNDKIFLESNIFQKEYLLKLNSNHKVIFRCLLPKDRINYGIVLSNYLDKNYYHWMMESIGRLAFIDPKELKKYTIIIDNDAPIFVKDSLMTLYNIPENRIYLRRKRRLKVSTLLVPWFPITRNSETQMTNVYSPETIRKIHTLSLAKTSHFDRRNNFIISRKNATQRRILNIESILDRYPDLNFSVVYLEEIPFNEQMQLFRNAGIIIATHGAGLVNLLFSEHAQIIEFFPSNRTNRDAFYFYQISQALKLKHTIIEYQALNPEQDFLLDDHYFDLIDQIIFTKDTNF